MMKKKRTQRGMYVVRLAACVVVAGTCVGCNESVVSNVMANLQDGVIATTTDIFDTFFTQHVTGTPAMAGEGGGDDLFANM